MKVSFKTVFNAVSLTMLLIQHGVGVDLWRRPIKEGGLLPVDHPLRSERVAPPSKPNGMNTGDETGLWYNLHILILIPGLRQLKQRSQSKSLKECFLTEDQARCYIGYYDVLKAHAEQYKDYRETIDQITGKSFPSNPDDLPENLKVLLRDEIVNNANHLLGRMIQAFYATETGDFEKFGLPENTAYYFKGGRYDVFERTCAYAKTHVVTCPLISVDSLEIDRVSLTQAIDYYRWLANPAVVEMITPQFKGAASGAGLMLSSLLDFVYQETGIDLRTIAVPKKVAKKLSNNKSLLDRIGQMERFFEDYKAQLDLSSLDITSMADLKAAIWARNAP